MIFLFFWAFLNFFSHKHRMAFIIFKTCFLETKTQCESAMTRLPGKLVPSLATLENISRAGGTACSVWHWPDPV